MKIYINNTEFKAKENINLQDFLEEINENITGIAIAINGNIIPKNTWETTILKNEDKIMLIKIACGG